MSSGRSKSLKRKPKAGVSHERPENKRFEFCLAKN